MFRNVCRHLPVVLKGPRVVSTLIKGDDCHLVIDRRDVNRTRLGKGLCWLDVGMAHVALDCAEVDPNEANEHSKRVTPGWRDGAVVRAIYLAIGLCWSLVHDVPRSAALSSSGDKRRSSDNTQQSSHSLRRAAKPATARICLLPSRLFSRPHGPMT
jgi:hypothetical protein